MTKSTNDVNDKTSNLNKYIRNVKLIVYSVLGVCLLIIGVKIVLSLVHLNNMGWSFKNNTSEIAINEPEYSSAMTSWENMDYLSAEKHFQKAQASSDTKHGIGSIESAAIRQKLGALYIDMGHYSNAYECLNNAYVTFQNELGNNDGNTIVAKGQIALYDIKIGNVESGFATLNELYDEATYASHKIQIAQMLAQCSTELGDYKKAIEWYDVLGDLYAGLDIINTGRVNLLNDYGVLMITVGNYEEAIKSLSSAVSTWEQIGLGEDNTLANVYSNLAQAQALSGQKEKAMESNKKALEIQKNLFGEENIHIAMSYNALSNMQKTMNNTDVQKEYIDTALQIALDTVGENHMCTAEIYLNLGDYYRQENNLTDAIVCHQKALEIRKNILGTKSVNTIMIYEALAEDYRDIHNYKLGIENTEYAIEIAEELYGKENLYSAHSYITAAWLYSDVKEHDKALDFALKAKVICDKQKNNAGTTRAYAYQTMGYVYLNNGDKENAINHLNDAIIYYQEADCNCEKEIQNTNQLLNKAKIM